MRSFVAVVILVGCSKHETPPPPAASKPEAAPPPVAKPAAPAKPATLAPDQKLGFADFWEVSGISRTDTVESVKAKLGAPKETDTSDGTSLRYDGASITFRDDKSLQLDFAAYTDADRAFHAAHASPPLALLGMSCADAAKHLAFTDKVEDYTTCKHYDKNGYLLDVTLMCMSTVSSLVVVYTPIPADIQPIPDHCGMPKD